jgi:hypothetical protein
MTAWRLQATVIAAATALMSAGTAQVVTPVDGGAAGGTVLTINDGPGTLTEPHVSGNLATYSDEDTGRIRYYEFLTSVDSPIPAPPGTIDTQGDVSGSRIAFIRMTNGVRRTHVYDTATGLLADIDPGVAYDPFLASMGGAMVAFQDAATGNGDIMVADIAAPTAPLTDVSASPAIDGNPRIAPSGDLVVWEQCDNRFICDIYRSARTGTRWGAATPVLAAPASEELNPDTDGTVIVYDSDRPGPGDADSMSRPPPAAPRPSCSCPATSETRT